MNTQPFSQTGEMVELCCEYLKIQNTKYKEIKESLHAKSRNAPVDFQIDF